MANTLVAFGCSFVGDGSTMSFSLDVSNDIYVLGTDINFSAGNLIEFSRTPAGLNPLGVMRIQAENIFGDLYAVSTSINGSIVTFNLSAAPANGEIVKVTGYIQFIK